MQLLGNIMNTTDKYIVEKILLMRMSTTLMSNLSLCWVWVIYQSSFEPLYLLHTKLTEDYNGYITNIA